MLNYAPFVSELPLCFVFVLCFCFCSLFCFFFFEVRKEFSDSWIWGLLIGFRFLGLRLIVDFVSFTVLHMFQIYQDLDVAFREKRRQCCLRSKQRKQ